MAPPTTHISRFLGHVAGRVLGVGGEAPSAGRGVATAALALVSRRLNRPGETMRRAPAAGRHPLAPSAIRVERGRGRTRGGRARHTAVTMWFGEGPALPAGISSRAPALRAAGRLGAGMVVVAALAAAAAAAARSDEPRIVETVVVPATGGDQP